MFGANLSNHKQFAAGDLVRISSLPRRQGNSPIWKPDPQGEFVGIVIDESDHRYRHQALVGQCLLIKLSSGELVTLSANMLEHAFTKD